MLHYVLCSEFPANKFKKKTKDSNSEDNSPLLTLTVAMATVRLTMLTA